MGEFWHCEWPLEPHNESLSLQRDAVPCDFQRMDVLDCVWYCGNRAAFLHLIIVRLRVHLRGRISVAAHPCIYKFGMWSHFDRIQYERSAGIEFGAAPPRCNLVRITLCCASEKERLQNGVRKYEFSRIFRHSMSFSTIENRVFAN